MSSTFCFLVFFLAIYLPVGNKQRQQQAEMTVTTHAIWMESRVELVLLRGHLPFSIHPY